MTIKKHAAITAILVLCSLFLYRAYAKGLRVDHLMERNRWRIVVAAGGKLFYINAKGGYVPVFREKQRETVRLDYPTFSPDGKEIAYCQYDGPNNYMIIYNVLDGTKRIIYKNKLGINNLSWSPDGKSILFLSNYDYISETLDLYTINIETKEIKMIVDNTVNAINACTPSWSFDSRNIIFSGINAKVMQINLENGELDVLFNGVCPSYSPNGLFIIYRQGKHEYKKQNGQTEYIMSGFKYYLYDIRTKKEEFLFDGGKSFGLLGSEVWESVIWSPDSEYIMFFRTYDIPNKEEIYLMQIKSKEKGFFTEGKVFSTGAISWTSIQ